MNPGKMIHQDYKKIGGWLLFYIFILTILKPFINIFQFVRFVDLSKKLKIFPSVYNFFLINNIVDIIVTLAGIFVGIYLWKKKKNCVEVAKFYLYGIIVVYVFIGLFANIYKFEGVNPTAINMIIDDINKAVVKSMVVAFLWVFYFVRSRRVHSTFGVYN